MDTQPKAETADSTPFYLRPKVERDAILRAAGIRPAATEEPRRAFKPLRSRPTVRSLWRRIFSWHL